MTAKLDKFTAHFSDIDDDDKKLIEVSPGKEEE